MYVRAVQLLEMTLAIMASFMLTVVSSENQQ